MPLHIPTLGERVTEADIWAYAARTLTDPDSYKAAGMTREPIVDDSKDADGTEQTILEVTADKLKVIYGWIDINAMDTDDKLTIRTYHDFGSGYRIHAVEDYEDAQSKSAIYVVDRMFKLGAKYKATIQQTAGVNRNYPYMFFEEVLG